MTRKLSIVTPDVPVKDVARLLALRGVGAAPVVSPQGELVGIVTEADFIALEARPDSRLHARPDRLVAEDVRGAVEAAGVRGSPRIEVLHGRVRISDVDTSDLVLLRRLVRDVPGVLGLEIAQPVGVAGARGEEVDQ
ncbi:CBS domain-containing protein [Parafrankia sp. EAN1pec]|uniref:CBS domain-containing protein n=1 Tax=Parafrankia sp. (strain EAN1pec) TaxID=298653 RepID=UPI0026A69B81